MTPSHRKPGELFLNVYNQIVFVICSGVQRRKGSANAIYALWSLTRGDTHLGWKFEWTNSAAQKKGTKVLSGEE